MNSKSKIQTLWMLADGNRIGGAESRMVKVASKLAQEHNIGRIQLVVPKELHKSYLNHKPLKNQLNNPKIGFTIVNHKGSAIIQLIHKILKKLKISNQWMNSVALRDRSWYKPLKRIVKDGDILHCYMGGNARNGAFIFSQIKYNKVIIEITNNRYLSKVSNSFSLLNKTNINHKNCFIRSVSKHVYKNWICQFDENWFENRNINNDYYNSPFIEFNHRNDKVEKEKIIIFPHRFVGPKNGILFSEIIAELLEKEKIKGWNIYFRGIGNDQGQIEENLQKWINKGIVKVGFTNNLYDELKKSRIAVSLIKTGSYPSQSMFEAMQAGCALLMGDSGNTKDEFKNPHIFFSKLNKSDIKNQLINITKLDDQKFREIEKEMTSYFRWFMENRNQINEIKKVYGIH